MIIMKSWKLLLLLPPPSDLLCNLCEAASGPLKWTSRLTAEPNSSRRKPSLLPSFSAAASRIGVSLLLRQRAVSQAGQPPAASYGGRNSQPVRARLDQMRPDQTKAD